MLIAFCTCEARDLPSSDQEFVGPLPVLFFSSLSFHYLESSSSVRQSLHPGTIQRILVASSYRPPGHSQPRATIASNVTLTITTRFSKLAFSRPPASGGTRPSGRDRGAHKFPSGCVPRHLVPALQSSQCCLSLASIFSKNHNPSPCQPEVGGDSAHLGLPELAPGSRGVQQTDEVIYLARQLANICTPLPDRT
jgi:hypothetical protein